MASNTVFRPATREDAARFYKGIPQLSFRGWVAEQGGKIVAIGGVSYEGGRPVAFSEITDAFRNSKKDVAKGCRILMRMIDTIRGPVYAVAQPGESTSAYLLIKLGWRPTGRFTELGELLVRE